jgi:hypothetical protein
MTDRDSRFVVADRPVNRRMALRAQAGNDEAARIAPARVRAVQARNRIGPPLAEQLHAAPSAGRERLAPRAIAGAVIASTGGLGLFLAWLQSSTFGGVAGVAALAAGLVLARPRPAGPTDLQATPGAVLDAAAVEAFDTAVERLAPELPPPVADALADLKLLVLRIARHPAAATVDEHFRLEDRLYVNECLRRYVPDSLQAYFTVPAEQRSAPLPDGQTPETLLLAQLAQLRGALQQREQALGRSAAEALLRQQRFLNAKAGDQRRL